LAEKGVKGLYVKEVGFLTFYLDDGITSELNDLNLAKEVVRLKHNL
jgi:hypothetical protein